MAKRKSVAKKLPSLPIPRTGYSTTLSEEVVSTICSHLEMGAPAKVSYEAAGVTKDTFYRWIAKAEGDAFSEIAYEDSPHMIFVDRITVAAAKGEIKLLEELREGQGGWQAKAWMLERTRFSQYGLKQEINHVVDMPGPHTPPKPPTTHEEWTRNKIERDRLQREAEDANYKEADDGEANSE